MTPLTERQRGMNTPTCQAWYASIAPDEMVVPQNLIDTECANAATKVAYRQGQPIYRCDKHAVGIQVTYWPIETGDPLRAAP